MDYLNPGFDLRSTSAPGFRAEGRAHGAEEMFGFICFVFAGLQLAGLQPVSSDKGAGPNRPRKQAGKRACRCVVTSIVVGGEDTWYSAPQRFANHWRRRNASSDELFVAPRATLSLIREKSCGAIKIPFLIGNLNWAITRQACQEQHHRVPPIRPLRIVKEQGKVPHRVSAIPFLALPLSFPHRIDFPAPILPPSFTLHAASPRDNIEPAPKLLER
jgi:hypothetical protein